MNTRTNLPRETLPLFEWYEGEARFFLANPEERASIIIHLREDLGELSNQVVFQWEEDL